MEPFLLQSAPLLRAKYAGRGIVMLFSLFLYRHNVPFELPADDELGGGIGWSSMAHRGRGGARPAVSAGNLVARRKVLMSDRGGAVELAFDEALHLVDARLLILVNPPNAVITRNRANV